MKEKPAELDGAFMRAFDYKKWENVTTLPLAICALQPWHTSCLRLPGLFLTDFKFRFYQESSGAIHYKQITQ